VTVPPEAITAAEDAYFGVIDGEIDGKDEPLRAAVEAAAPLIRADVRDRIRQLAITHNAVTHWPHKCSDQGCPAFQHDVPFADLIGGPQ
jgi:hypothetical protein